MPLTNGTIMDVNILDTETLRQFLQTPDINKTLKDFQNKYYLFRISNGKKDEKSKTLKKHELIEFEQRLYNPNPNTKYDQFLRFSNPDRRRLFKLYGFSTRNTNEEKKETNTECKK